MKRIIIGLAICAMAVGSAAIAQDSPIKQRQDVMKKNGDTAKLINAMFKGDQPYDADKAAAAIKDIGASMDKFVTLFPDGSTSKDSDAKAEIWQNKADFDSWATKAKEDAAKAAAAAPGGVATLQPAFAALGKDCRGCHEKYRAEK